MTFPFDVSEEAFLHSILNDAVSTLDARRGAMFLPEDQTGPLRLRAQASGRNQSPNGSGFNETLAHRAFDRGESLLYRNVRDDPAIVGAGGIAEGTLASVLCILLRTPQNKLGVLYLDRGPLQNPFTQTELHFADTTAAHVSAGIESAQLLQKQRQLFDDTVTALVQMINMRDPPTGRHSAQVAVYSSLLGQEVGLSAEELNWLRIGALLHDFGKVQIGDKILYKPGRLTAAEFEIVKTHTTIGAKTIEQIPFLAPVISIVRSHHERWDGGGYPDGLAGENFPRLARIVAVADTFDAMTTDQPYRAAMPADVAFSEIEEMRGTQFDPNIATAFLAIRQKVEQAMKSESR